MISRRYDSLLLKAGAVCGSPARTDLRGGCQVTGIPTATRKPIIEATDLEKALEVSTPTANSLIKALIDKQIVVEITGQQRCRVYSFNRYFNLFVS